MNLPNLKSAAERAYDVMANNPVLIVVAAVILIYAVLFIVPAFIIGIRDGFSDRQVEKTKDQATTEKTAGQQERISAGEPELERKTEDRYREEKLKPERERVNQSLAESRARRQQAEDKYAKTRLNRSDPDPDDLNLRRRNCADLVELYPGQRFAGCQ